MREPVRQEKLPLKPLEERSLRPGEQRLPELPTNRKFDWLVSD